jgi:hypothetical protein
VTHRAQIATTAERSPAAPTVFALKFGRSAIGRHPGPAAKFPYIRAIVACLCIGGLSLLVLPHAISYDGMSWLVWGRQLDHLALSTRAAGTSFKPLTVFIDALLTLSGHIAPSLWLLVVRASTALALALAFHLANRLQGPIAGLIAVAGLFTAHQLMSYVTLEGEAEPLIVVCCLAAVDLGLVGRHRAALAWLIAASLLELDLIAFVLLYLLFYQWYLHRRRWTTVLALVTVGVLTALAWTLPDLISSGDLLRSAGLAKIPSDGGPLLTSVPGWDVIREVGSLTLAPVAIGWCAELVADAWSLVRRKVMRPLFVPTVGTALFMLGEAVATQLRITTGNSRYLLAGAGLMAVVGACFWVEVAGAATTAGVPGLTTVGRCEAQSGCLARDRGYPRCHPFRRGIRRLEREEREKSAQLGDR